MPQNIYQFIEQQEKAYALPVTIIDGYEWSMKEHIRLTILYKNSQFSTGNSKEERDDKPFDNIVLPLLRLQYRSEGFDVKDIKVYVDNEMEFFKSFLIEKYHERWADENEIDTFIDNMVESYVDFGGALIKDVNDVKPEVTPLQSIAFCDQTNLLAGPIGLKHDYSPEELMSFQSVGWGNPKNGATMTLEDLIAVAGQFKTPDPMNGQQVKTPGTYIECYEVQGQLPEAWLKTDGSMTKYVRQMQIIAKYKDKDGKTQYQVLFAGRQKASIFRLILRDAIYGRALGLGGVEELFDAQVWTNYSAIAKKQMLDAVTKIFWKTTDPAFKQRNNISDVDNNEVLYIEDGKLFEQANGQAVNFQAFEALKSDWDARSKEIASATGAVAGVSQGSHIAFNALSLLTAQGLAIHDYRQGKIATFTGNIYRDWVMPYLVREIVGGKKFLSELSGDELAQVAQAVVENQVNDIIKDRILKGQVMTPDIEAKMRNDLLQNFVKGGNKRFLEIFKGEMHETPLGVKVSIKDKQKDLNAFVDQLMKMMAQVIAAPQILDDPRMVKMLNQIMEAAGFSPIDYGFKAATPTPTPLQNIPQNANPNLIPTPQRMGA